MDPNTITPGQPNSQQPLPQTGVAPQPAMNPVTIPGYQQSGVGGAMPSASPATPMAQPYSPSYAAPIAGSYPTPIQKPHKSKKGLVIGLSIVAGVLVLIFGLFVALMVPAVQSAGLARTFISNVIAGNVDSAVVLTGDNSSKDFLTTASKVLKGANASLSEQKYSSSGPSHYLFTLSGVEMKYARVDVEKTAGKRLVSGLIYSKEKLSLVTALSTDKTQTPSTSEANSSTPTTPAQTSTPSNTTGSTCLGSTSFAAINSIPVSATSGGLYNWSDAVFFKADSTEYEYASIMDDWYGRYRAFYSQNSSKQFSVILRGRVYSATPAVDLANSRAEKIKNELVSKSGIDTSRIAIEAPANSTYNDAAAARSVDVEIISPDSCK